MLLIMKNCGFYGFIVNLEWVFKGELIVIFLNFFIKKWWEDFDFYFIVLVLYNKI